MINLATLEKVIEMQRNWPDVDYTERSITQSLPAESDKHAFIVSGIRRCGKSTLLRHFMKQISNEKKLYLNFDTPRLFNFDIEDFEVLDLILEKRDVKYLFFDEIQIVEGWEMYVRQKLDEGCKVFITGSNATLLSSELGTRLTGRHITRELFPFSFKEYLRYTSQQNTLDAFTNYLENGGFPEFLRSKNPEILQSLLDDILYRDIAVRNGIRDVQSLKRLVIYLFTNVGGLLTAGKLSSTLGIKSPATVLEYLGFLEQSYLIKLLPRFSWSYRAQITLPRKIYIVDNGLVNAVSVSFSQNTGRKFENAVFGFLRQQYPELYYFQSESSECDFVAFQGGKPVLLLQVCAELNSDNIRREKNGLWEAMDFFKLNEAILLTLNQKDFIKKGGQKIIVTTATEFFNNL